MTARKKGDEAPAETTTEEKVAAAFDQDAQVLADVEQAAADGVEQARTEEDDEVVDLEVETIAADLGFTFGLYVLLVEGGVDPQAVRDLSVAASPLGDRMEVKVRHYDSHGTLVGTVLTAPLLRVAAEFDLDAPVPYELAATATDTGSND
ncbi:hypothetical protein ACFWH7_03440 [Cellulosimicrobium cellulans]|uniref:hypothetical protein n=1 Tax=Cellulosimicrobium cellulans TaxID=1710 RepID=UPI00364B1868